MVCRRGIILQSLSTRESDFDIENDPLDLFLRDASKLDS